MHPYWKLIYKHMIASQELMDAGFVGAVAITGDKYRHIEAYDNRTACGKKLKGSVRTKTFRVPGYERVSGFYGVKRCQACLRKYNDSKL